MNINYQLIQAIGASATAIGVFVAAYQIKQSKRQATTSFEDDLAKEYRSICAKLPTKVFLGESLTSVEMEDHLDEFYQYFDLTNSQIFFRQIGRVSKETWNFWMEGMQTNMALAAFSLAWSSIGPRTGSSFSEYRHLIEDRFATDPREWC